MLKGKTTKNSELNHTVKQDSDSCVYLLPEVLSPPPPLSGGGGGKGWEDEPRELADPSDPKLLILWGMKKFCHLPPFL